MQKWLLLSLFSMLSSIGFSQSIRGTITDEENNFISALFNEGVLFSRKSSTQIKGSNAFTPELRKRFIKFIVELLRVL